jgi:hypothetical protein
LSWGTILRSEPVRADFGWKQYPAFAESMWTWRSEPQSHFQVSATLWVIWQISWILTEQGTSPVNNPTILQCSHILLLSLLLGACIPCMYTVHIIYIYTYIYIDSIKPMNSWSYMFLTFAFLGLRWFACECVWKQSEVDLCSFAYGARGCVWKAGMSAFGMSCWVPGFIDCHRRYCMLHFHTFSMIQHVLTLDWWSI